MRPSPPPAAQPRVQVVTWFNFQDNPFWTGGLLRGDGTRKPSYDRFGGAGRRESTAARMDTVSDERDDTRLDEVQAYYDRLAPRLVAVESRNWHLQSRMALNLETIDRFARPGGRVLDVGLRHRLPAGAARRARLLAGIGIDLSPRVGGARARAASPRSAPPTG